jgi:hypothetical protein
VGTVEIAQAAGAWLVGNGRLLLVLGMSVSVMEGQTEMSQD